MYKIIKILIVITLLLGSAITYINPIASAEEKILIGTRLNNVVNFVLDYLLIMHL